MNNVIENKRQAEEERKRRIFHEKYRLIGVDTSTLQMQIAEKNMKMAQQGRLETEQDEKMLQYDNVLQLYAQKFNANKAYERKCIDDFNKRLHRERMHKDMVSKMKERQLEEEEIERTTRGDLLQEDVNQGFFLNSGRKRIYPSTYKGMTPEMKEEILHKQAEQAMESKLKKEEETRKEIMQNELALIIDNRAINLMQQFEAKKRFREKKVQLENIQMNREQQRNKIYSQNELYSNIPDESFYKYFNSTSR